MQVSKDLLQGASSPWATAPFKRTSSNVDWPWATQYSEYIHVPLNGLLQLEQMLSFSDFAELFLTLPFPKNVPNTFPKYIFLIYHFYYSAIYNQCNTVGDKKSQQKNHLLTHTTPNHTEVYKGKKLHQHQQMLGCASVQNNCITRPKKINVLKMLNSLLSCI